MIRSQTADDASSDLGEAYKITKTGTEAQQFALSHREFEEGLL